ncbi:aquaporin-like protein [Aspergillus spinulosporus]
MSRQHTTFSRHRNDTSTSQTRPPLNVRAGNGNGSGLNRSAMNANPATSNHSSDRTISQNTFQTQADGSGGNPPPFSLARPQFSRNQGAAYIDPDYRAHNPNYGKSQDAPVWSLTSPLPHVVRNGRWGKKKKPPQDHGEEEDTQDGGEGTERGYSRPNANAPREPASEEAPAFEPPDRADQEGKAEAQEATDDNRDFFNHWGMIRHYIRRELAEWLGMTVAMLLGLCAGLSTFTSSNQAGSFPSLAAAWGFGFMVAIYLAGGISGGHLNPAITISMWIWRGFPARRCLTYTIAQVIGAITAAGIAYALYHDAIVQLAASSNVPQSQTDVKQAMVVTPKPFVQPVASFFTEFVGSAILIGTILALGDDSNAPPGAGMQAFIIGIIITVLVLALGYTTGGCFNPARDFGARLVTVMAGWGGQMFTEYHIWWLWGPWVADILGGLFGGFMYDLIIFTGGESPINYTPKRRKRAFILKNRNARARMGMGQEKIPDLERAAQEFE